MPYSQLGAKAQIQPGFTFPPVFFEEAHQNQRGQVSSGLAADKAYQAIKYQIVNLIYPPGSLIKDTDLMETLDLGRTPIREALKKLEVELLVVTRPRQGTYVSEISLSDFSQQFPIHRELTSLAVSLAVHQKTTSNLQRLKMQHRLLESVIDEGMVSLIRAVLRFEYQIAVCAENYYLEQMMERYCGYTQRIWLLIAHELDREVFQLDDYSRLLDYMEQGDQQQARALISQHMYEVHSNVLQYF